MSEAVFSFIAELSPTLKTEQRQRLNDHKNWENMSKNGREQNAIVRLHAKVKMCISGS